MEIVSVVHVNVDAQNIREFVISVKNGVIIAKPVKIYNFNNPPNGGFFMLNNFLLKKNLSFLHFPLSFLRRQESGLYSAQ